jgi:hypothetical protein
MGVLFTILSLFISCFHMDEPGAMLHHNDFKRFSTVYFHMDEPGAMLQVRDGLRPKHTTQKDRPNL